MSRCDAFPLPIGYIMTYYNDAIVSDNYLRCDGSYRLIVDEPALFAVIKFNCGPRHVGSYFRLPDFRPHYSYVKAR